MPINRTPRSLPAMLAGALVRATYLTVLLSAYPVTTHLMGTDTAHGALSTPDSPATPAEMRDLANREGSARLIRVHRCWTGVAPAGAVAGAAVVTLPGHTRPVFTRDPGTVGRALDQSLHIRQHGYTVHGYCR